MYAQVVAGMWAVADAGEGPVDDAHPRLVDAALVMDHRLDTAARRFQLADAAVVSKPGGGLVDGSGGRITKRLNVNVDRHGRPPYSPA
ncbi:hypothetical protein GCM10023263_03590 [Phytohabitans rumicis]